MSRDPRYQRLLNSRRWWEVKAIVFRRANGLCERCREEGRLSFGTDCHHVIPVETGRTEAEMESLCYNPDNCRLLCIPCHIKTHAEARSHCKDMVAENKARARHRFMEANDPNYHPTADQENPAAPDLVQADSTPKFTGESSM